jgi:hypothetical protein
MLEACRRRLPMWICGRRMRRRQVLESRRRGLPRRMIVVGRASIEAQVFFESVRISLLLDYRWLLHTLFVGVKVVVAAQLRRLPTSRDVP